MSALRILISDSYNPWFNLATEDWIFSELDPDSQVLFLWRNENTVVIGRNQNPWLECNLPRMEADGVLLARRTSGGGAVFHDLGNTCFTFLSPKAGYLRSQNVAILLQALQSLGVTAEASGRNDLIVNLPDGPRKISGSAYRETATKAFHHGTFLLSTDLGRLGQYLTPHPKKLQSKGLPSVRARVTNLQELAPGVNHENLSQAIIQAFCAYHGGEAQPERLDQKWLEGQPSLQKMFTQFSSWDWRFGHAPQFQHQITERLSLGLFDLHLNSEHGHICGAQIFSDSLFPELVQALQASLIGKPYARRGMKAAVGEVIAAFPEQQQGLLEMEDWLCAQVEV